MKHYEQVHEFSIKEVGETTGEEFVGKFKCKRILTHSQQLEVDRLRRQFLGAGENPTLRAGNQAGVLAQLVVRITEAPGWWENSGKGLDLYDDNIIRKVYEETMKAEADWIADIQKRAEEAKANLKQG